jgi:hypothetical protein
MAELSISPESGGNPLIQTFPSLLQIAMSSSPSPVTVSTPFSSTEDVTFARVTGVRIRLRIRASSRIRVGWFSPLSVLLPFTI